jgi:hypothetical protein
MSDAPEIVYVDFDGFGIPESIWLGGDVRGSVIYTRKNLHDAALARIAELEVERDAAYAKGYWAGVEDAANKIIASIQMLRNLGMTEHAEAFVAAAEDIRALQTKGGV